MASISASSKFQRENSSDLSRLNSDVDKDTSNIVDFFIDMLRINAVNPSMGGPGEVERARYIEQFMRREGLKVSIIDVPDDGYSKKVRPNICTSLEGKDDS